jgi:hypothetical protein
VCRKGILEVGRILLVDELGLDRSCSWMRCGSSTIALRPDQEVLGCDKDVPMADVEAGSRLMMNGIFLYKSEAWLRKRFYGGYDINAMAAECGVDKKTIVLALRYIGIIHEGYNRRPLNLPGGWPRSAKVHFKKKCTQPVRLYVVRCNADYIVASRFIVRDK